MPAPLTPQLQLHLQQRPVSARVPDDLPPLCSAHSSLLLLPVSVHLHSVWRRNAVAFWSYGQQPRKQSALHSARGQGCSGGDTRALVDSPVVCSGHRTHAHCARLDGCSLVTDIENDTCAM